MGKNALLDFVVEATYAFGGVVSVGAEEPAMDTGMDVVVGFEKQGLCDYCWMLNCDLLIDSGERTSITGRRPEVLLLTLLTLTMLMLLAIVSVRERNGWSYSGLCRSSLSSL